MDDGRTTVVTPVKLYLQNQNSFCRICNLDFTVSGKDGAHNLLHTRKRASSNISEVSIRCKLEGLLGQAVEDNLFTISAVICKACCRKVERLYKALEGINELKNDFQTTEALHSSAATEPMPVSRKKRMSNSPHSSSGVRKRIPLTPRNHDAFPGQFSSNQTENVTPESNFLAYKQNRQRIIFPSPSSPASYLVKPDDLPFHDVSMPFCDAYKKQDTVIEVMQYEISKYSYAAPFLQRG